MTLPERVTEWGARWHQRVAVRRWPDADEAPFKVEVAGGERSDPEPGAALAVEMGLATEDEHHRLSLRGAVKINDEHLLAIIDVEVRVSVDDSEALADDELIEFAQDWGYDYLMSYLRVGLADSVTQVGISNLVLPPTFVTRPSREVAVQLLADARERAEARADAQPE